MSKEKLSVPMINMYCQVIKDKFAARISNCYGEDAAFRKKIEKKYGFDKLKKQFNALNDKINKEVQKNNTFMRLNKLVAEYQMKIRLASCPEEIKQIFEKLDKEV